MLPTDLDSSFGELRLTGQTFARRHAGVVSFLEFAFEFSQLAGAESRAIPAEFPLLLLVVVSRSVRVLLLLLLQQLRLRRVMRSGEGGAAAGMVSGRRRWRHAVRPHRRIFRTGIGRVLTQRTATTAAAETAAAAFAGAATASMTTVGRI
jgi:hypothetical protein